MSKFLVLLLVMPIWMTMLFQPFLNDLEEARNFVVTVALERATEDAAVEGFYTDTIKQEMVDLIKRVGYDDSDIELVLTDTLQQRGLYVEGTVKVPNTYSNIILKTLFNTGEQDLHHVVSATRMSEYLE